jgi:lambda family phage portal protein
MLGAYAEAEVAAARAETENLGFIENELGDGSVPPDSGSAVSPLPVSLPSQTASFFELPAGYKVNLPDVRHPTTAFSAFLTEMLRGIASGLNVAYHSLTGDLSNANFSSLRQGASDDRAGWRECQRLLIEHFCQAVYPEWLDMAVLAGAVSMAARDMDAARFPIWEPRGWDYAGNPLQEAKADIMSIESGLDTRTRICASRGLNYPDVLDQLAEEQKMAAAKGVNLSAVKDPTVDQQDVTEGQPTSSSGGKQNAA